MNPQKIQGISVRNINFPDNNMLKVLLGEYDGNIKKIEKLEKVKLRAKGNTLSISGDDDCVDFICKLVSQLYSLIERSYPVYPSDVEYAHRILSENGSIDIEKIFLDTVFISSKIIQPF